MQGSAGASLLRRNISSVNLAFSAAQYRKYGSAFYAIINVSKIIQIDTALKGTTNNIITRLDP